MSWIRPRGQSASPASTRYVGQSLRQRPHEMHVARSSARTCEERMIGAVWVEISLRYRDRMALQTRASIAERLRAVLPGDRVIDDPTTLEPYAYDASFWSLRMQRRPHVVVLPQTAGGVVATIRGSGARGA